MLELKIIKTLRIIALILVSISVFTHFSTYFIALNFPYEVLLALLGIGTFIVFIPSIILVRSIMTENKMTSFWKHVLSKLPVSFRISMPILFFYTIFNFIYSINVLNKGGLSPDITEEGKYVLEYRGDIKEEITETAYYQHKAYLFRGISGHFMLFQYVSLIILIRIVQQREEKI